MQFFCPACSTRYQMAAAYGGQPFACRECKTLMTIPSPQRGIVITNPRSMMIAPTSKTRNAIQLVGGLLLCMSIPACAVGLAVSHPPIVGLSLVGLVLGGLAWRIGRTGE
jgi:hypothetical protein